jgi:hypothetical protein
MGEDGEHYETSLMSYIRTARQGTLMDCCDEEEDEDGDGDEDEEEPNGASSLNCRQSCFQIQDMSDPYPYVREFDWDKCICSGPQLDSPPLLPNPNSLFLAILAALSLYSSPLFGSSAAHPSDSDYYCAV